MHLHHEGIHRREHVIRLVNDEVWAFSDNHQIVVGNQRCDLYDHLFGVVEAGHFEVHPNKHDLTLRA